MSLYTITEPLILEPNQHYSTPQNRPNSTPPIEPIQTQPNPPYPIHHPPHTTHPPHPPHLPPRRYYAPLPSPPDHHHHHHPTHPAYHPEGTMHLGLRPPTTTTTTTQPTPLTPPTTQKVLCTFAFAPRPPPPPTTTPPNHPPLHHPTTHPPIRYECVFYHRCICSIVNNNIIHVIECPCGLVVKCKCIPLYQLQYCNALLVTVFWWDKEISLKIQKT